MNYTPHLAVGHHADGHKTMAECRGLAPLARRHALVSIPTRRDSLVPWAFQISIVIVVLLVLVIGKNSRTRTRTTTRGKIGPRGRTCTCNLSGLSGMSLLVGLHAGKIGNRQSQIANWNGAHGRICTGTVRVLSALSLHWTTWAAGALCATARQGCICHWLAEP